MIGRFLAKSEGVVNEPVSFDDFELLLGDVMRGERATLGKTLKAVSKDLHIKDKYLEAIENKDLSGFENQSMIGGFVRAYAEYLGLDPAWAYETFCLETGFVSPSAFGQSNKQNKRSLSGNSVAIGSFFRSGTGAGHSAPLGNADAKFRPIDHSPRDLHFAPGAIGSFAVLALVVAGLGFGGYNFVRSIQTVELTPVVQAPGVVTEAPQPSITISGISSPTDVALPRRPASGDALERLYRPKALDAPILVARDAPIGVINPNTQGALADAAARELVEPNFDAAASVTVLAKLSDMAIFATKESWVRVSAGDGTVVFEKVMQSGDRYDLPQDIAGLKLRTGNAGAIYFAVDGSPYGPVGEQGSVAKNIALSETDVTGTYDVAEIVPDSPLAKAVARLEIAQ